MLVSPSPGPRSTWWRRMTITGQAPAASGEPVQRYRHGIQRSPGTRRAVVVGQRQQPAHPPSTRPRRGTPLQAYVDSAVGGSSPKADLRTASAALTATMSVNGQVISDVGVPGSVRTMPRDQGLRGQRRCEQANLRFAAGNLARPASTLTAGRSCLTRDAATSTDACPRLLRGRAGHQPLLDARQRSDELATPGLPLPANNPSGPRM